MMIEGRRQGAVFEILLNRPAKRNALTDDDFVAFTRLVREVASSDVRAVLIHGAGGSFSAGYDLGSSNLVAAMDAEKLIKETVNPLFKAIREIPVPTIAAVEGHCLGGGFGIAFACDIILVAETAVLGSPFREIGLVADSGTHLYLRERLGYHLAAELIFTGRFLSGREAADLGLVNQALPVGDVLAEARRMAAQIAEGPTRAFRESKRILQLGTGLDDVLEREAVAQGMVITSQDAVEGVRAFQQKRRPVFRGS